LLYGMGAKSLADRLAISVEEAQALFDKYFSVYPGIAAWSAEQVRFGREHGYVTSKFGRRLPIWEFLSDKRWIQQKGERACVNYGVQGAATGDYMKIAMVRVQRALREHGLLERVRLVMNVHDALEFYVDRSVQPHELITILEPAVIFEVDGWPAMKADWHIAKRWGSPRDVELRDGKLIVKGRKEFEVVPAVEQDEETGELVEVLPEVSLDVLRAAAGVSTQDDLPRHDVLARAAIARGVMTGIEPGRRVVVNLADMPEQQAWDRFWEYLVARPGPNHVTVHTPEGVLPLYLPGGGTSIGPEQRGEIGVIVGAVEVSYVAEDIDFERITRGLEL
jgi:hypothetical protein